MKLFFMGGNANEALAIRMAVCLSSSDTMAQGGGPLTKDLYDCIIVGQLPQLAIADALECLYLAKENGMPIACTHLAPDEVKKISDHIIGDISHGIHALRVGIESGKTA